MSGLQRQTRSQSRQRDIVVLETNDSDEKSIEPTTTSAIALPLRSKIRTLPPRLTTTNTGLTTAQIQLLVAKRKKLRAPETQIRRFITEQRPTSELSEAVRAAFVFAQEEAGTAVCIREDGLLLTCSHCIADTKDGANKLRMWLVSAEGRMVQAQCMCLLPLLIRSLNCNIWPADRFMRAQVLLGTSSVILL